MKTLIILSSTIGYLLLTSLTIPDKMLQMGYVENVYHNYNPPTHGNLWRNCDLYYVVRNYAGIIYPDTNFYLIGSYYFHSTEKRVHRISILDTTIRLVDAYSIAISVDQERGNARITNYEGTMTIKTDKQSFGLESNETLIINKEGNYEKFYNEFSSADSLWLTNGEIWFNNVDVRTLITRMALNFGCKVKYNFEPGDERIVNAPNIFFDCKSGSLSDGLQLLQTLATGNQKFSYRVNKGVIYIEKYTS